MWKRTRSESKKNTGTKRAESTLCYLYRHSQPVITNTFPLISNKTKWVSFWLSSRVLFHFAFPTSQYKITSNFSHVLALFRGWSCLFHPSIPSQTRSDQTFEYLWTTWKMVFRLLPYTRHFLMFSRYFLKFNLMKFIIDRRQKKKNAKPESSESNKENLMNSQWGGDGGERDIQEMEKKHDLKEVRDIGIQVTKRHSSVYWCGLAQQLSLEKWF